MVEIIIETLLFIYSSFDSIPIPIIEYHYISETQSIDNNLISFSLFSNLLSKSSLQAMILLYNQNLEVITHHSSAISVYIGSVFLIFRSFKFVIYLRFRNQKVTLKYFWFFFMGLLSVTEKCLVFLFLSSDQFFFFFCFQISNQ